MLTVQTISDRMEIERYVPLCRKLAQESGYDLPFHHLSMPLVWWAHFNTTDGVPFSQKRGMNFLGLQSGLQKLFLLVLRDGSEIVGTVPVVIYSVRLPGEKDARGLVTFPGDFFVTYHDFNVSPKVRPEAISALLDAMVELPEGHGLVMLSHIPENSPNIQDLKLCVNGLSRKGFYCHTAVTGSSGGVRPWTRESIVSCLRRLEGAIKDPSRNEKIVNLMADLEACPPLKLIFPLTRNSLEEKLRDVIDSIDHGDEEVETMIHQLETSLADAPVLYLFIQLQEGRESYVKTLSRATRKHIRNMRNKFKNNGGSYEKIDASRVSEKDIDDYMGLHDLRWGEHSVSIVNDTTYNSQRDLCRRLSSEGCFTLFFARYQGKRIASLSCVDTQGRREALMAGRDPEYDHLSAGFLLMFESIMDAIDHGLHAFDFGMGWYAYKTRFTKTHIRTLNFFISPEASTDYLTKLFLGYECMIPAEESPDFR